MTSDDFPRCPLGPRPNAGEQLLQPLLAGRPADPFEACLSGCLPRRSRSPRGGPTGSGGWPSLALPAVPLGVNRISMVRGAPQAPGVPGRCAGTGGRPRFRLGVERRSRARRCRAHGCMTAVARDRGRRSVPVAVNRDRTTPARSSQMRRCWETFKQRSGDNAGSSCSCSCS